ncbi:MAG: NAD(P)/FAD-dependent oxidoreductase [Pseudomonadota bacterium]|nr:NAD(P)/FAD-dependent oxidoreductase [Pseudomonadota bacterium]MDP1906466.1 NAD(P)/FAD-dependent oxidoreductase [Pseudomonadota bacterium]MDP2353938.1 NAD(P)/FAD-dependent oxidoreductase [Pseudomonadota bacterium]
MIVAILGAGPAGMSCANACLSFGLKPVVIERGDHLGGAQRSNFHPNLWMLGFPGETGEQMTTRLAAHYRELPVTTHYRAEVTRVAASGDGFLLTLAGAEGVRTLSVQAIVLATGTRPRATPALERFAAECPRAIIGPLSDSIRDDIRDTDVLILGGGDNALDHALFLAERGNRAVVCTRARFSARKPFIATCRARGDIELREHCARPELGHGNERVTAAWANEQRAFDWLLVMYGYLPNTDVLAAFDPAIRPALSAGGYLHVDAWQRSGVPGIYAAGDITDTPQPSVPTAMAQGLTAARAAERDLVKS